MALIIFLYVIGILLVLVGLAGLVIPVLPGAPLMYLGILALAWADGFTRIGPPGLVITGVIATLIFVADYAAGAVGAKAFGSSWWGLFGAFLGMIVGFPLGLPGLIFGPIVGAIVLEYFKEPDFKRAGKVGLGTLVGFILGTAVKYALAFLLIGVTLLFYFF
jgi:uncharacterized protein YqgC (DUF456 family)